VTNRRPGWIPTGGRLRDEDWARRHRLLTLILAGTVAGLTLFGALIEGLDGYCLATVLLTLPCVIAAVRLPGRRMPSIAVSLGFVVACGGFVALCNGVTEAHFTFFIAVAALALYRDWAPFGVFLAATTLHHGLLGILDNDHTYDHHGAQMHPLVWAALHGFAVLLAATFQVVGWHLTVIEERRAQANLDESQAQLSVAFDETPVPMAMIAPDGVLLRTNAAYREWLRLPDELPAGFAVKDLPITPIEGLPPLFDELVMNGSRNAIRAYRRHDDDSTIWVEVHSTPLHDQSGQLRLIFVHCMDVTKARLHEQELRHQVRHDSLTGLLSREGFEQDLAARMASRPEPATVLYLDIDRFKSINDGSGHSAGDAVLRALAARLESTVPAGSLLARFGGDEFVVALAGGLEAGEAVGHTVVDAFAEPLPVGDNLLSLSASVGLAVAASADQAEDAVLAADTAMYVAKRDGGNRMMVFNDRMRVAIQERITGEKLLRAALEGDRTRTLPVWYQPIVLAETGEIVGAEALVRLRTPDGRIHSPYVFVPAAEETGLIVPLGEHVLISAFNQLLAWRDDLRYISVNVSPRQLAEPDFVPLLADLLSAHPELDPSRIVLEITETAMLGSSVDVQERLEIIKALGVRIALDDFGTGYSSLTWLQSVPADVVKLDRSFVAGLAEDPKKSSIIQAVLWLARSMGMTTVAEGVEEQADVEALRAAGCPLLQGYAFGKPMPPAQFDRDCLQRSRMATTP
jgi:diguanylate cyclase (GGDEF)-like protein/PAS domain S-box-containing protein